MIVDVNYRTVNCDGCDKSVTFEHKDAKEVTEHNPWLQNIRIIQTAKGVNAVFCSDSCLVKKTGEGFLNGEEPKRIIEIPKGSNLLEQAKAAAVAAAEGTKALKAGGPVTLHGG